MKRVVKLLSEIGRVVSFVAWFTALIVIVFTLTSRRSNGVTRMETEGNHEFGEPHPIETPKLAVFIHGAGGGGWEWKQWVPIFEKAGYKCVAKDLVRTSKGLAATRFDDYLDQVKAWSSSPDKPKVVLIGASMGGILALRAAMDIQPAALVLVNSVGPKGMNKPKNTSYPPIVRWAGGPFRETVASMPDSDEDMQRFAWTHWRDESGAVLREIAQGIEVTPPKCPLLVVLGDKDTDVPNQVGEQMALTYSGSTLTFKDMSHVGPLLGTKAPDVANGVLRWLDGKLR